MMTKAMRRWVVAIILSAGAAVAQDADLTILVDGPLLEHGGLVEVTAVPSANTPTDAQTITVTDRYVRIELPYAQGASYNYRFRPVPAAKSREGMERFVTEALRTGGRTIEGPDGPVEGDFRSVRVLPFAEYGGADDAIRTDAAWGQTQSFADLPPANHWGARALPWVFDTFGDRRTVGMMCGDQSGIEVCTPDPKDALLMEALWWRKIAEGRLERLRHNALAACYDSGGLFGRPDSCDGVSGRGWPEYRPAN